MFGAAMSQGAQALTSKPVAGGYTGDYYASKQRDAQVIRIQSSDADIQVNCGNLRSNFPNASAITGAHMQDIYYAFKSFTTPHRFYNAEQGMKLQVIIKSITWIAPELVFSSENYELYAETVKQIVRVETRGDPIDIDLEIAGKQCLSEQEMVDYIHERFNMKHAQAELLIKDMPQQVLTSPTQLQAFVAVFDHAQIAYMAEAKKMSVYVSPQDGGMKCKRNIYQTPFAGLIKTCVDWVIGGFELIIRAHPDISQSFQTRMARMLGFVEMIQHPSGNTIGNEFQFPVFSFLPFHRQKAKNYFKPNGVKYWDDTTVGNYRSEILTQAYYDSVKNVMQMVRYPRIYVRSSLLNNIWRGDGSKGDDIAVIPIVGDITKNIVTYESPGGNRTYEVKETTIGALSFGIRLTDENGDLIEFIEDYELQLVFFYCPDKMVVSQF